MTEESHIQFESLPVMDTLEPIGLDEMDSIKLMNRIDTKYVTDEDTLVTLLSRAADAHYRVLVIEGEKISPYNSMYYDTDSLKMYTDHHNCRLVRQKVRTREYLLTGLTFLEIKLKNNTGRTRKKRVSIPASEFTGFSDDPMAVDFLARKSGFPVGMLSPRLETKFRRITLVNQAKTERLTIDTCMEFVNHDTGISSGMKNAVIIEIKQDGRHASEMKDILLDLRVKAISVSKYCIGTALTNPFCKRNRFKLKIRKIEKRIHNHIATFE